MNTIKKSEALFGKLLNLNFYYFHIFSLSVVQTLYNSACKQRFINFFKREDVLVHLIVFTLL